MKITEISPYFLRYFPEYGEITENYGDAKIRRSFPKKNGDLRKLRRNPSTNLYKNIQYFSNK